ncbi:3-oxoacyl-ACP synthase [Mesorhizobium sp. M2D.F.Ca.ET.185.01.1.1]|uniref:beta-ketoacyl synthase N-terminal-like domain-containing protein n=1 Tax=unclassified Mesorhizobium TaxID=325217 RepID=UPI000FCCD2F3|nr:MULTISPECIES: beta-ketoacyl synthase N-terminal-like domain-containing protein [unclassified Mesorhizobium]TGP74970.1 3-oxoacyl-ACP synthase [bacterium M00.F.Ca.ET.227.01.1.1]TGP85297.1 3-oxoacyl-ACP synthase [bacterium M00.F.Ca.ET.221.01.1.1]TGP89723.1 3-oxoacyl-ACP synthase [bacterium M00.F.Ca.ET.222.01.1.1]TGT67776.1 3-oxoacyl-ACP synthase [bacterium M00.F.Ca.ET.159.01.1.1]TGT80216.1 3-oxoacyl-ACP synthase [bacterium M00.F.Ca.ET.157.01.1.1]TGU05726.1 3-oxoacyl-ACP synthase [bacterium M0
MTGSIEVASIGMVTAVGLDAPSSCAAMRAKVDGFQETRFRGPRGGWLTGAPVPLPRTWIGEKRIAHLAAGAIVEAFDNFPEARGQTALILCIGEEGRPGHPVRNPANLLRRIADIVEVDAYSRSRVVAYGRPSGHVALEQARRLISTGEMPYVMIVGVDSYLTSETIRHYIGENRILAPQNPNGFIPGEAAAAVVLSRRGARTLRLTGLGLARELAAIYNKEDLPLRGDGMTAAYRAALDQTGIEMNRLGYRISDLIGEQYWFRQTALASLRLIRGRDAFQDLWSPTEFVGNVGAAVVPMMIGMAWTAARKGYDKGNPVLIEASNDSGACGAAIFAVAS